MNGAPIGPLGVRIDIKKLYYWPLGEINKTTITIKDK